MLLKGPSAVPVANPCDQGTLCLANLLHGQEDFGNILEDSLAGWSAIFMLQDLAEGPGATLGSRNLELAVVIFGQVTRVAHVLHDCVLDVLIQGAAPRHHFG